MIGYLPVAKVGVQVVSSFGVTKILADIIKNNVTIVTTAQKVTVTAGSMVLASLLVEQSSNHIERVATEVSSWFTKKETDEDSEKPKK